MDDSLATTDPAIGWAQSALSTEIRGCERLTGGLTSTMLALSDASGRDLVLG